LIGTFEISIDFYFSFFVTTSSAKMSSLNSAAWLRSEKTDLIVEPAPYPVPGLHEVVIRNRAIGLIPVESKQQKMGIFPLAYPNVILGTSVSTGLRNLKASQH
jgi:hypothetical protein